MPRSRPPYPREFREEAVRLAQSSGRPIAQIARELGIAHGTLSAWVKQAELDAAASGVCSVGGSYEPVGYGKSTLRAVRWLKPVPDEYWRGRRNSKSRLLAPPKRPTSAARPSSAFRARDRRGGPTQEMQEIAWANYADSTPQPPCRSSPLHQIRVVGHYVPCTPSLSGGYEVVVLGVWSAARRIRDPDVTPSRAQKTHQCVHVDVGVAVLGP